MKKFKLPALVLMLMLCICIIVSCDALTTENPNETEKADTAVTEHEHTIIVDSAVAPTCTETGLTEGKHCSACNEILTAQETVAALGHTEAVDAAVAPTCTETGLTAGKHCSACNEILTAQETIAALGHNEIVDSAVAPTCTETGLTEGKHCSVCSAVLVEQTEVDMIEHSFEAGVCSVCSEVDKNSDEYKYSVLKKKADASVFASAETALRNILKNPSSMQVMSEKIVDSDEYFRYVVRINYTATNSYGGTVSNTKYILLRINPKMNGTFFNGGVEDYILTSDKESFGWGTKPDDFNYDAFDAIANPEEVSLKLILAYPEQYVGKYVKIKEELVLSANYIKDKQISTVQSTGDGQYDYNYDNKIYVFYRMCDNLDDLILLDADYQKITVCGYVRQYSNSTDPYIDAYEITINKTFD